MTAEEARAIALSFQGACEQDHHGRPSFRVGGRIFATLWTPEQLNVMLEPGRVLQVAEEEPERCEVVLWGKQVAAVRVQLVRADARLVEALLAEAWHRRAG